jgi:catechol O-methyltransferase
LFNLPPLFSLKNKERKEKELIMASRPISDPAPEHATKISPEEEQATYAKHASMKKWFDIPEEDIIESHDGREASLLKYIYSHPKLDSELRGSPTAIMAVMDEFADKEEFLINIGHKKAEILTGLIHEHKPKVLLELGTYVGYCSPFSFFIAPPHPISINRLLLILTNVYSGTRYSALFFGSVMRDASLKSGDEKPRIYSLELDPLIASVAMNFVNLAGLGDIVEIIVGSSAHTLQRLRDEGVLGSDNVDMIFLDHAEELYKPDLELCEKLGYLDKPGTLVLADNVVRPGAPEYREYVRSNSRFSKSWGVRSLITPGDFEVCFTSFLQFCLAFVYSDNTCADLRTTGRDRG